MANDTQYDLSVAAKDPDFIRADMKDKIAYLSAHDADFAKGSLQDQMGYINDVLLKTPQTKEPAVGLESSYNPNVEAFAEKYPHLGVAARFLDSVGGAAISAVDPINWAKGMKFLAASYLDQQKGPMQQQISDALDQWKNNPNVRKAAPSLLPEALGQGIGTVAGAKAIGPITKGAGKAAGTAVSKTVGPAKPALLFGADIIQHPEQIPGRALKWTINKVLPDKPPPAEPNPTTIANRFPSAMSSATPVGNAPLPPIPKGEPTPFPPVQKLSDIKAAARAEAKAAEAARKGGMTPPPFAGATSSAMPIGNAPLPEVPQGSPTPFPTVQPKAKVAAAGAETTAAAPPSGTSLLSRGRTLVEPGAEPDLNNPAHVKMINDYQTMSGPALRQLASAGDRFAAFVLRHMPRP